MPTDPHAKRLLWFVFMGSKGGLNRIRLISVIRKNPLNANQLAKEMGLDYKAIQHHIGVLEKNCAAIAEITIDAQNPSKIFLLSLRYSLYCCFMD